MRKVLTGGVIAASLMLAGAVSAGVMPEVRFPRGGTGVMLEGSVASPDRNIYRLSARAGQTLRVRVQSPDDNAVIQVYGPRTRYSQAEGYWTFSRDGLPGAQDGQDAREFSTRLPTTGTYLIVVGPSRGSTDYGLSISIR